MFRLCTPLRHAACALRTEAPADVVVIGAGVVGSAFVSKLSQSMPELRVVVLDGGRQPPALQTVEHLPTPDLRTFAITPASSEFFGADVWDNMKRARATPFRQMQVCVHATATTGRCVPCVWKYICTYCCEMN